MIYKKTEKKEVSNMPDITIDNLEIVRLENSGLVFFSIFLLLFSFSYFSISIFFI